MAKRKGNSKKSFLTNLNIPNHIKIGSKIALYSLLAASVITLSAINVALLQTSSKRESDISKLKREYNYWTQVVIIHPDYRDGWLKLALASWNLGKEDEARLYIANAERLDKESDKVEGIKNVLGIQD